MYMIESREGRLLVYGPVPSSAAHLPELSLVIYAAVAFGGIALGLAYLALAAMAAAVVGVPLLSVIVKARYAREGRSAVLASSERVEGGLLRLSLLVEGKGELVLYAREKDLRRLQDINISLPAREAYDGPR